MSTEGLDGRPDAASRTLKVTVVGDSGTGKTCLLKAFANNKFPEEEVDGQSLFENSKGTLRGKHAYDITYTIEGFTC